METNYFVFFYMLDANKSKNKHMYNFAGPFKVLDKAKQMVALQRDDVVQRVSVK